MERIDLDGIADVKERRAAKKLLAMLRGDGNYVDDSYIWEEYGIETSVFAAIALSVFGVVIAASYLQGRPNQQQWGSGNQLGGTAGGVGGGEGGGAGNLFSSSGSPDFVVPSKPQHSAAAVYPRGGVDPEQMLRARLARFDKKPT